MQKYFHLCYYNNNKSKSLKKVYFSTLSIFPTHYLARVKAGLFWDRWVVKVYVGYVRSTDTVVESLNKRYFTPRLYCHPLDKIVLQRN